MSSPVPYDQTRYQRIQKEEETLGGLRRQRQGRHADPSLGADGGHEDGDGGEENPERQRRSEDEYELCGEFPLWRDVRRRGRGRHDGGTWDEMEE